MHSNSLESGGISYPAIRDNPMTSAPHGFAQSATYIKAPARDQFADNSDVTGLVAKILDEVRAEGDAAVRRYSRQFDRADLDSFEVTPMPWA